MLSVNVVLAEPVSKWSRWVLKYRIITALIAIPLLFLAIWYLPSLYFALLVALLIAFSAWEWTSLMGLPKTYLRYVYVFIVLLGLYFVQALPIFPVLLLGLLIWIWAALAVFRFNQGHQSLGFQFPEVQAVTGFFILVTCWLALINLRLGAGDFGAIRLMLGLLIVFAADTGAYFAGRFWGRHPLASKVSPKKTWEGVVGGLVLAFIVAAVPTFFIPMTMKQRISLWILAILVALFSVVGDLTISMLKRQTGLKDTGHLLPGHGGLLDRVDSIASGILVFSLGLLLLGV